MRSTSDGSVLKQMQHARRFDCDVDLVRGRLASVPLAIFIAATNFRAIDVIDPLEIDTGLQVVTSNQAAMWMALRTLGVPAELPGFGRLFRGGGNR